MTYIKYSQILNYILLTLFDIRKNGSNIFVSLPSLLNILEYSAHFGEAIEIAEYLETRDYIKTEYVIGDILMQITPNGMLYIEDLETSFIEKYKNYMDILGKKKEINLRSYIPVQNPKSSVLELVEKMLTKVKKTNSQEKDLLYDLEIIKLELSKSRPDIRIIETKTDELTHHTYLIEEASELKSYMAHAV